MMLMKLDSYSENQDFAALTFKGWMFHGDHGLKEHQPDGQGITTVLDLVGRAETMSTPSTTSLCASIRSCRAASLR